MPWSTNECKTLVMKMGLWHKQIPCYPHSHVFFERELEDALHCPHCNTSRCVPGLDSFPQKVLRYFSIVNRLNQMFQVLKIAKLIKWHAIDHSPDGKMRLVADSKHWVDIDKRFKEFVVVTNNYKLDLVGDGVNPYKHQFSKHSPWSWVNAD
jgi:hypothetical protein